MSQYSETNTEILEKAPAKKGSLLLSSDPFAFILKSSCRGIHCENCLKKRHGLQRCSRCAIAYYCNRNCQKIAWDIHKYECFNLKKLKPNYPPDTVRLLARVLFRLQKASNDNVERGEGKFNRKFKDLMSHYKDIKEDPKRLEHFNVLYKALEMYIGDEYLQNTVDVLGIYGRILINSFTLTDKDLNPVGTGVYLAGSIFDHSCKPNAYASFRGTKLFVHSLVDWPQLDFKNVRISYIDVMNTTSHRRKELKSGYYFNCDCPFCEDEEREKIYSSISCGNESCLSPVPVHIENVEVTVGPCLKCGYGDFPEDIEEKYLQIIKLTEEKLDEMKDKYHLDACQFLLNKQGNLLHPLNVWRVKTLDAAFEAAVSLNSWDSALSYGNLNLDGLKFYYGSNHPNYALALLKMGKIELYLFKHFDALKHLQEAEPILRVSHGKESCIYTEDLEPLLNQARKEIAAMQNSGFNVFKNSPSQPSILSH